ncbi:MAG: FtsB family cell division protein [Gemmatimonadota bacterium]
MIRKLAAGAVVLGAAYFLLFGGEYTFLDLWRLDREHEDEVAELETIRQEVEALEQKADSLATDSAALERLARERYGLIKEGERLYRFVEPDTSRADDR